LQREERDRAKEKSRSSKDICRKSEGLGRKEDEKKFPKRALQQVMSLRRLQRALKSEEPRDHQVGLCQNGAEVMVQAGASFREILCHYYTYIDIQRIWQPNWRWIVLLLLIAIIVLVRVLWRRKMLRISLQEMLLC